MSDKDVAFLKHIVRAISRHGSGHKRSISARFIKWHNTLQHVSQALIVYSVKAFHSKNDKAVRIARLVLANRALWEKAEHARYIRQNLDLETLAATLQINYQGLRIIKCYIASDVESQNNMSTYVVQSLLLSIMRIQVINNEELENMCFPMCPENDARSTWSTLAVDCISFAFAIPDNVKTIAKLPAFDVIASLCHENSYFFDVMVMTVCVLPPCILYASYHMNLLANKEQFSYATAYIKIVISWCTTLSSNDLGMLYDSVVVDISYLLQHAPNYLHPAAFLTLHVLLMTYKVLGKYENGDKMHIASWTVLKHVVKMAQYDDTEFAVNYDGWEMYIPFPEDCDSATSPFCVVVSSIMNGLYFIDVARSILSDVFDDKLPGRCTLYNRRVCATCFAKTIKACPCKMVRYCNRACQKTDFARHRRQCNCSKT